MDPPKHSLTCWQVSASGVCTQRNESSIHIQRRGKRCKQLLDDLKETTRYWELKENTLARILWKRLWTCRQTDYGKKESRKETMNFLLRQGLVIFLETQGLRAFYRPLPTLKCTCGEAQNTAVTEWDISWRTHWSPTGHPPYWQCIISHRLSFDTFMSCSKLSTCTENKIEKSKIPSITCCEATTGGIQV